MTKLLIIDDNMSNRLIARHICEDLQYEVEEADGVSAALGYVASGEYPIILLDWMMPDIDGLEFLSLLRETEQGRQAKVIMCTAKTGLDNREKALQAGADAFIEKPLTQEALKTAIANISAPQPE